ncbi:MAG: hypothetical protein K8T26_06705 [Lentisphaerae bacterium]|nr:hypothetical protein [Lentisphaerota bacterium]
MKYDFEVLFCSADANDPAVFERNVAAARQQGYRAIHINATVAPTPEQRWLEGDTWEYFTFINSALFKVFETDLIAGYFKPETYRRNQETLRWKNEILQRHGMRACMGAMREPQWMPTPWYDDKPELKGCDCEHPSIALAPHYALNIDHPRVLEHYRQLARQLAQLAPCVEMLWFNTNDSGAGINWCRGLYPGPNGPAATRDRDMGERMRDWMQAITAGGRDAGVSYRLLWDLCHFTPEELQSTARALGDSLIVLSGNSDKCNTPFTGYRLHLHLNAVAGTGSRVATTAHTDGGYEYSPMLALPLLHLAGESLMALRDAGVQTLTQAYRQGGPLPGSKAPLQMLMEQAVKTCPASTHDLEAQVFAVAHALVGDAHAAALYDAWRDLDLAHRSWRGEWEHFLYYFYSVVGRRWLTRPFVPDPARLSAEERGYWSSFVMKDRDPELGFRTLFACENRVMFSLADYHWYYDALEVMDQYLSHGIAGLDRQLTIAPSGAEAWVWLRDQRDRLAMFRCLVRCNLHATGVQWVIDRFAGKPEADKYAQPREKKRLYDMIDGEMQNCRDLIQLLEYAVAPLIALGEEATYTLPVNVADVLKTKIEVMQRHRHGVEDVFPGVTGTAHRVSNYSVKGGVITAEEADRERQ